MTLLMASMLLGATLCVAFTRTAAAERESVLDRRVTIYPEIVRDVPDLPPLCDSLSVTRQRVNIGDCALYTEQEGSGTPIVLLHGGPGATHHGFHPAFSAAASFARVIYYDQRGCGSSDYEPGAGYSVPQAVEDLDKLREALGIEKWVVLGHSYGSFLAQRYALAHPDRVKGLVLVGCAYDGRENERDLRSPEEKARIDEIWEDSSLTVPQLIYNIQRNGDWKRQNFYRPTEDELVRRARYECTHDEPFQRVMGQSMSRLYWGNVFEQCPLSILLIEGRWDLGWDAEHPERFHGRYRDARLILHERAGHSPFNDEPDTFFAALRQFTENLPDVPAERIAVWRETIAAQEREVAAARTRENSRSPEAELVRNVGWGRRSNATIAAAYTIDWLERLDDPTLLLKTGFALCDAGRYDDALAAFRAMPGSDPAALLWQGHMLDLLGRHAEAIPLYESIARNEGACLSFEQYGLSRIGSAWARERIATPFTRIENKSPD